jgi:hypothetical protein
METNLQSFLSLFTRTVSRLGKLQYSIRQSSHRLFAPKSPESQFLGPIIEFRPRLALEKATTTAAFGGTGIASKQDSMQPSVSLEGIASFPHQKQSHRPVGFTPLRWLLYRRRPNSP